METVTAEQRKGGTGGNGKKAGIAVEPAHDPVQLLGRDSGSPGPPVGPAAVVDRKQKHDLPQGMEDRVVWSGGDLRETKKKEREAGVGLTGEEEREALLSL